MATRTESVRNLVGVESLAYIRAIRLSLSLKAARPNTLMNIFFDSVNVNFYCRLTESSNYGENLSTDANGELNILLDLPGGTFTTGTKNVYITDAPSIETAEINGSVYGKASAKFTSTGIQELYQETVTITDIQEVVIEQTIPTVTIQRPQTAGGDGGGDPLAQSFFTFGIDTGCFLTSIDLFFNTRDPNGIPVILDIRPLINGYPKSGMVGDPNLVCVVQANNIQISNDASVPTKFQFPVPVYLNSNTEYCFVVFSNSNQYNIFTSKLGEKSFETGKTIFEQPYIGSMFKSENNLTWSAEQFEDIKFTLNIAKFDTSTIGRLNLKTNAQPFGIAGSYITTKANSLEITVKQTVQHGFEIGRVVYIACDANAVYNGISYQNIAGERLITSVIDEYTFTFIAGGNDVASVDGPIFTGGQVKSIVINNPGMQYSIAPTVVISAPSMGTQAEAIAIINPHTKTVVRVIITEPGNGYTTPPSVSFISSDGGMAASATAIIDATFTIFGNKPVDFVIPNIPVKKFAQAELNATIRSAQFNYTGGSLPSYNTYSVPAQFSVDSKTDLPVHSVITSEHDTVGGKTYSTILEYKLQSSNQNLSPVIDLRNNPKLISYNNRIRSHKTDDIENGGSTGSISSTFVKLNAGSGYITPPTVTIDGTNNSAKIIAVLGSAGVSSITNILSTDDFTSEPNVIIDPPSSGTQAKAVAVLKYRTIDRINLDFGGIEYPDDIIPDVQISGGGQYASGAVATAIMGIGIRDVWVQESGTGYITGNVTVTISAPFETDGRQATAIAIVDANGGISRIQITEPGSGYSTLHPPTIQLSDPSIGAESAVLSTITYTRTIKNIAVLNGGSNYETVPSVFIALPSNISTSVLFRPGIATAQLTPAGIDRIIVIDGGTGYTIEPVVTISGGGGTSASAESRITGKSIERLELDPSYSLPGGSGYTQPPKLIFTRTDGSTGVDAEFITALSGFNSETSSDNSGIGLSRYITKTYTIETISTGINLFSEIYSIQETSVDWYIRISKSGSSSQHTDLPWYILKCDMPRNRSSKPGEKFDYKFYLYDLPEFDTYDLKCVMRSTNPIKTPSVYNFRSILIA